jgi:PAS domain-containing protein
MKRICAWCRKELGTTDSDRDSEKAITHGICGNCRDNIMFQMGVELQVFLDSLNVPILVVNSTGAVVTANNRAQALLRKRLSQIAGYRGGDVFECAYARLPEGCGNTVHCSGCAIRRTVMETYGTGRSFQRVQATLNQNTPKIPQKIKLSISTEKLAEIVLLRIDDMDPNDAAQIAAGDSSTDTLAERC